MLKRIALGGPPLAGKTTLAKLLVEKHGYRHATMSSLIVDELVTQLNNQHEYPYDAGDIYRNKEFWRPRLQELGDQMGFQDPKKILGLMQKSLKLAGAWEYPDDPVVLESIRGEVQASAARALGFVVVDLWVDEFTQYQRAGSEEAYLKMKSAASSRPDIESGVESASLRFTPAFPLENIVTTLQILDERELSHGPADQPFKPGSLANWSVLQ
jgi:hypothetical protein